jgi:hypothetical protein
LNDEVKASFFISSFGTRHSALDIPRSPPLRAGDDVQFTITLKPAPPIATHRDLSRRLASFHEKP